MLRPASARETRRRDEAEAEGSRPTVIGSSHAYCSVSAFWRRFSLVEGTNPNSRRRRRRRPAQRGLAFSELYFGKAAAENEVAADPARFLRTYDDRWDLPAQVVDHSKFLVLGPKGAGKSAAAAFVSLSWKQELGEEATFVSAVDFDELNRTQTPLTGLDQKLVGSEVTALTDSAWKLFLGVRIYESLLRDQACDLAHDQQATAFLQRLKDAGLASDDFPKVLRVVRERKGSIALPKILNIEFGGKESESFSPGQLGDALFKLLLSARTPNRHLLSIDGLDKAIAENDAYWLTLAALLRVSDGLRRRAQENGADHLYIMVMCRSDVFRRVQFSDAPKIAADGGVHLGWNAEAADPKQVLLWDYVARKAEVPREKLLTVLPVGVPVGVGGEETLKYLLGFTRYTPRDMSLLFGHLQRRWSGARLTGEQVRAAADEFASQDLLQEITAEANGLLPGKVVNRLQGILSSMPKRIVSPSDMKTALEDNGVADQITPTELGEYLFLQGALGNYDPSSHYVQFYHRRDSYKFRHRGPWVLHTGIVYAMNIPWAGI